MSDDTGNLQGNEVGYGKPPTDKQFGKPGGNKRNRFGRPKSFDALRKLAVKIAGENVPESEVTRIEAMLRVMSTSRNPADRALFLAYAYGKPRENIDITSLGEKLKGYTVLANPDDWPEKPKDGTG
jgi:hypothetical protein